MASTTILTASFASLALHFKALVHRGLYTILEFLHTPLLDVYYLPVAVKCLCNLNSFFLRLLLQGDVGGQNWRDLEGTNVS